MHTHQEIIILVLRRILYQLLCWRRRCQTSFVTSSSQLATVASMQKNEKRKSSENMIKLPYEYSEWRSTESRNCDGNCMLRRRGAVIDGSTQKTTVLYLKSFSNFSPSGVCWRLLAVFQKQTIEFASRFNDWEVCGTVYLPRIRHQLLTTFWVYSISTSFWASF